MDFSVALLFLFVRQLLDFLTLTLFLPAKKKKMSVNHLPVVSESDKPFPTGKELG
jgi:hypothetical protein